MPGLTQPSGRPHVVVVGAGAFGGWTALHLVRLGARVTLIDAWGAGNSRSSSGGETRMFRHTYGGERLHVELAAESLVQWRAAEAAFGEELLIQTGALWMATEETAYEREALPLLTEFGVSHEVWEPAELARHYPQIDCTGVRWALFEKDAGYLRARRACELVRAACVREGATFRISAALAPVPDCADLQSLALVDETTLSADAFVFACGPWLPRLFPDWMRDVIRTTRQEVYFFGSPAGDARFCFPALPPWAEHSGTFWYGIPDKDQRGFKLGDDTRGPVIDPTTVDRAPTPAVLAAAREYLGRRFPDMRDAPVVEGRVCQYSDTPDGRFLVGRHPRAGNVWIAGGGSGHGFKHGPAIGERLARAVVEGAELPVDFAIDRFETEAPAPRAE